MIAALLG